MRSPMLNLMKSQTNPENAISSFFDRESRSMIERHETKGIPASAKKHVEAIVQAKAKTALDVGSGPGSIALELLKSGVPKVMGIDLSPKMNEIAMERLKNKGYDETQFSFSAGSFIDLTVEEPIDAVSVHRVMCCHPEGKRIAEKSTDLKPKIIVNTMPRDWKLLKAILAPIGWLAGKRGAFRPYVHSQKEIDQTFERSGYRLKEREKSIMWVTSVYEKMD